MRVLKFLKDLTLEAFGGYSPAFFAAGVMAHGFDYVTQVLFILMFTAAYVRRNQYATDENYIAFLAGYFSAAAASLA
jgi:hypothetical protein